MVLLMSLCQMCAIGLTFCLEGTEYACINCAVEESALHERAEKLLPQDEFVSGHITEDDVLVVSIGGNDIALKPSFAVGANLVSISQLPISTLEYNPSYLYFVRLFREGIQHYVGKIIKLRRPKKIIVCGIYFPCMYGEGWADTTLWLMRYNSYPGKLQTIIKSIFTEALRDLKVCEIKVEYLPLYKILDPHDPDDYVSRVEPSNKGGKKSVRPLLA